MSYLFITDMSLIVPLRAWGTGIMKATVKKRTNVVVFILRRDCTSHHIASASLNQSPRSVWIRPWVQPSLLQVISLPPSWSLRLQRPTPQSSDDLLKLEVVHSSCMDMPGRALRITQSSARKGFFKPMKVSTIFSFSMMVSLLVLHLPEYLIYFFYLWVAMVK